MSEPSGWIGITVVSACPACGVVTGRDAYDIGSGPELSCALCEWCWGMDGQPLDPGDVFRRETGEQ